MLPYNPIGRHHSSKKIVLKSYVDGSDNMFSSREMMTLDYFVKHFKPSLFKVSSSSFYVLMLPLKTPMVTLGALLLSCSPPMWFENMFLCISNIGVYMYFWSPRERERVYDSIIHHLRWWSPTLKWLIKITNNIYIKLYLSPRVMHQSPDAPPWVARPPRDSLRDTRGSFSLDGSLRVTRRLYGACIC